MKSRRKGILLALSLAIVLCGFSVPALAAFDTFFATVDQDGIVQGGGTGFMGGTWFYYPATNWWNQWFYNAPFDPTRWKIIDLEFVLTPVAPQGNQPAEIPQSWAVVTINWSTAAWPEQGLDRPPLPDDVAQAPWYEGRYIARAPALFANALLEQVGISEHFEILPFNPEWVSIDIRGANFTIEGWIEHVCVPVPSTLLLLASGAVGLGFLKRRRS